MHVVASNPDSVAALLRQPYVRDPGVTVIACCSTIACRTVCSGGPSTARSTSA
jgi:hypothetical protein